MGYEFNAKEAKDKCVKWIRDWFDENGKGCNAVIGISGGKDSTVVAALCAEALGPERVIGVMLPDIIQLDIKDSRDIIKHLGIRGIEYNIGQAKHAMVASMMEAMAAAGIDKEVTKQTMENLPPRLRMSALYAVAQTFNGRVSNNCNLSETWIGYSTIYGDTAGDFSPISNFTVSEVIAIGRELGIPERFLVKPPADGLSGQTDEDKIGFAYEVLDRYLRTGRIENTFVKKLIDAMHKDNAFKHRPMAAFQYGSVRITPAWN